MGDAWVTRLERPPAGYRPLRTSEWATLRLGQEVYLGRWRHRHIVCGRDAEGEPLVRGGGEPFRLRSYPGMVYVKIVAGQARSVERDVREPD